MKASLLWIIFSVLIIRFGKWNSRTLHFKNKSQFIAFQLFWFVFWVVGTMMLDFYIDLSSLEKVGAYVTLVKEDRAFIRVPDNEEDSYVSSYYTRREINEDFLIQTILEDQEYYEAYSLQGLTAIKAGESRWLLLLNGNQMGYVEIKNRLLFEEFRIVWDWISLYQRKQFFETNTPGALKAPGHFYELMICRNPPVCPALRAC